MTRWGRARLSLLCVAILCGVGCGARTGLLVDGERSDAGPEDDADLYGEFPCTYSRVGELQPLRRDVVSSDPDIAWGQNRLGSTVSNDPVLPRVGTSVCDLEPLSVICTANDTGALGPGRARIAWDGEAFEVCWADRTALAVVELQRYAEEGTPLWSTPRTVVEARGSCRELVWSGGHSLVGISSTGGVLNHVTHVYEMDREGSLGTEILDVPGYHSEDAPFALAGDDEVAAAAWVDTEGLHVRAIQGIPESEVSFLVWPAAHHLALALRGTEAGVVWAVDSGETFRVFLTLFELTTGGVSDQTELGAAPGSLAGVDVVGVPEGFLVAWSERRGGRHREVVVPTRTHEGPRVETRQEVVIDDSPAVSGSTLSGPSLTYDGLDVYIAVTLIDRSDGSPEVYVQRLACHR